jgi:cytochrome c peroxidase
LNWKIMGIVFFSCLLTACYGDDQRALTTDLSQSAQLGKQLFEDKGLSASGLQSCASCHDPAMSFIDPTQDAVSLGGLAMDLPGLRNAPSLRYTKFIPSFYFDEDSGAPMGGQFSDGRANTLAEQAAKPFTSSFEMANKDATEFFERLKTRPYFQDFVDLYGENSLNDPEIALAKAAEAIAAFESEAPEFQPFSSKFDGWLKGRAQLSPRELRGWHLFNDRDKGNCAACHPSSKAQGLPPMFTDFTYDNLGVPRNEAIAANNENNALDYVPRNGDDRHDYYDLGLCGPLRENLARDTRLCGAFRVPTLRNVANTAPYFHNGRFNTLKETLDFYVRRDTSPEMFYFFNTMGEVEKFDDLPRNFHGNVNTHEAPYNRQRGEDPALNDDEIEDLIAFLCTLSDGYDPTNTQSTVLSAQCPQA